MERLRLQLPIIILAVRIFHVGIVKHRRSQNRNPRRAGIFPIEPHQIPSAHVFNSSAQCVGEVCRRKWRGTATFPWPQGANEMLVNNSSLPLMRFMAASMSNMIGDTRLDAASTIAGSTLARFLGVGLGAILQGALPPLLRLPQRGRD